MLIPISFRAWVIVNDYFESFITRTPRLHHQDDWGNIHRRTLIRGHKSACLQVFQRNYARAIHMQSLNAEAPLIVNIHMFMGHM